MLTDKQEIDIKKILNTNVNEHQSGHLYCTQNGINKSANLLGLNYKIMGKESKSKFRAALIDIYQSNYFTSLNTFLNSYKL